MDQLYEKVVATAGIINQRAGVDAHDVVLVLGSGLGAYPDRFPDSVSIPYGELPGFPRPGAVGHAGIAHSVKMGENRVLLLAGRVHAYEGHPMDVVTFPIRTAVMAGCGTVILTNAAGGCGDGLVPGDLMLISDHINMAGLSPLAGPNDERLGPRFPDMTDVYTPRLRDAARAAGERAGVSLGEGVYLWWRGPMFETPAEIQMARILGASLVGMSTVPEATAARHMGADILGISLVTNLAAGMSGQRLTAEEVIETADAAAGRFAALFDELLPTL
jgi:purine-nucleoside phosphorylase